MKPVKIIKWTLVLLLLALVAAGLVLWRLGRGMPDAYRPAELSIEQRREVAFNHFTPRMLQFHNSAQEDRPFAWSVSQEQLNNYLASVDEVAGLAEPANAEHVRRQMEHAGIAAPAVALEPGQITLMVYSVKHKAVLSVHVGVQSQAGEVSFSLEGVDVGRLPLPRHYARQVLEELQHRLAPPSGASALPVRADPVGGMIDNLPEMFVSILSAIDGGPLDATFRVPGTGRWVTVERVEIADAALTLHVVPAERPPG